MKFKYDHDLHIHSYLSSCSNDPEQTPQRILDYGKKYGLTTLCLTDHFWDETVEGASEWYAVHDYPHISKALPLPQYDGIRFLFGCETEMNRFLTVGISKERMEELDFIIIPTTHMHMNRYAMNGYTIFEEQSKNVRTRAEAWVKRFEHLLNMDLPFYKVGVAHLAYGLIAPSRQETLEVLDLITDDDYAMLFKKAAQVGIGIELNHSDMSFKDEESDIILRPFRIARECGCKFYLGTDAHNPKTFDDAREVFNRAIDMLSLEEKDKFIIGG
ncbi:MAG: PHP domain-containing protein [Clostridiales bacterium]|nr:PHP domain-containing protein [Clostridiales bacterium]